MIGRYISYLRRVLPAYLGTGVSQLSFWHDRPKAMPRSQRNLIGSDSQYFRQKAPGLLLSVEA